MLKGGFILSTLSKGPSVPTNMPCAFNVFFIFWANTVFGTLLSLVSTKSIPKKSPAPLMSPIASKRFANS